MRSTADTSKLSSDQDRWRSREISCGSNVNCLRQAYGMRIGQLTNYRR
jgi:hypothetical protein